MNKKYFNIFMTEGEQNVICIKFDKNCNEYQNNTARQFFIYILYAIILELNFDLLEESYKELLNSQ